MPIPDYETLMLPLLRIAEANKPNDVSLPDAVGQLADEFKLSDKERRELLPSDATFKFSSRVSWARTYLQKTGLIESARRGYFKITKRGIEGVIREDKVGLDNIYIQAKRWTDKPVGSHEIDQFAGALSKKKAGKGIFITSSTFTMDALSQ